MQTADYNIIPPKDQQDLQLLAIPTALLCRRQWVAWRYDQRGDKQTKLPINPHTGRTARTDAPTTWSTFGDALACSDWGQLDGIGYVFSPNDPYTGIDLDHCRDATTGMIATWAQAIITALDSYTEISPS